ncbi:MAG TPA: glycerophosphodiester phosphodiesterase family protein, partial [Chitinophagaceae bacterium]|nr:glycerophosphodiester phosphodiesterase family protein [Chitinophagaceae bacterium]
MNCIKPVIFFISIILLLQLDASAQTVSLPTCKHRFVVIAHRGNHINAPENTLAAYQDAIDAGADFVEIDLRTTKDSQLVIMHNSTIDQMTGLKGKIKDLMFDSLQQIKIREKQHPEWGL